MASFNSPLADKGRDTRNRLERCWSVTLNWGLFPEVLREVSRHYCFLLTCNSLLFCIAIIIYLLCMNNRKIAL